MGIRIHKAIGYGLTDLKTKGDDESPDLDDPRINPRGFLGEDSDREHEKYSLERYLKFIEKFSWAVPSRKKRRKEPAQMERMLLQDRNEKKRSRLNFPYDSVEWDNEAGQANVLLVIPPSMVSEWRRHDDAVDYCEETESPSGIDGRTVLLKNAPYPWNIWREDLRTGKPIFEDWRWTKQNYAEEPGTDWRWIVPPEVACICKFLKLFTDDDVIKSLRPMLHVWWS